jgi:hypothetical protein
MQIAADVARKAGLQNIRVRSAEVTGNTINAFVVLTCVSRAPATNHSGL